MKKIKAVLAGFALLFLISSFATEPEKVSQEVKQAFAKDFSNAQKVTWDQTAEFYFAAFKLNDHTVEAAYNVNGDLVGTSRRIEAQQMPMSIMMTIKDEYKGSELSKTAVELTYNGVTRYYVKILTDYRVIRLKCSNYNGLEVDEKSEILHID